jgi:uncharacterized protein (DUF924 family)
MSLSQAWLLTSTTAAAAFAAAMGLRQPDPMQSAPEVPTMAAPAAATVQQIPTPAEALAVVDFWRDAGPDLWFAKDPEFDRTFRERFLSLYEAATRGELRNWLKTPNGALALVVLLDQFPRNSFRDTPRMYATDAAALEIADAAIAAGHDRAVESELQFFFYLPFGHSEDLADQERSVALARRLGEPTLSQAEHHRDIIRRFGRFPHRNTALGRTSTREEQAFLDAGGFSG